MRKAWLSFENSFQQSTQFNKWNKNLFWEDKCGDNDVENQMNISLQHDIDESFSLYFIQVLKNLSWRLLMPSGPHPQHPPIWVTIGYSLTISSNELQNPACLPPTRSWRNLIAFKNSIECRIEKILISDFYLNIITGAVITFQISFFTIIQIGINAKS